jgi:hypothetical protein
MMATLPSLDFDDYHRRVLPERLATDAGRIAARDLEGVAPIAFRLADGPAYCFRPARATIDITAGDDAPTVVELDARAWQDFVHELATWAGLVYGGRAHFVRGGPDALERWEPALRLLIGGRPIFDPASAATGIELARTFTRDDPSDELRRFLRATGFLLVKRVFAPDEIARLVETVERFQEAARPGDGRSWWAKTANDASVLCRLVYLGLAAPEIAALSDDARLRRLASLADEPLRPTVDRADGHSVVIKNANVSEGLSDLPWHRDCGLGGHPVTCPTINVGVQLDAATAETGQLCFVPGSWRFSCHRGDLARACTIALDTEPGDCTVHFGDTCTPRRRRRARDPAAARST